MPTDDDDDDVAMDEGAEPADTESDSTDGGDADEPRVAAGGPVTAVIPVRKGARPISSKVREVFAASMAKQKAKPPSDDDEGALEPLEHEDAPAEPAPAKSDDKEEPALAAPAETATPKPSPAPSAAPAPVPPPAPPAPALDPEVMRLRSDLEQQRRAFDEEKAKFFADQSEHDVSKLRGTFLEKGAPAVVEVLKHWTGEKLEGDALKRKVGDLITELASTYLDAPIEESVRERIANERVRDGLKIWKADQERAEQQRLAQEKASHEKQNRLRLEGILQQEVTKPEHAKLYPFLAAEDNPGELVYAVLAEHHEKTGQQLTWMEAAQKAEDWLAPQRRAFFDKRRHLLSPTPPAPQAAPADKQRAQGDNQVSRSHAPPKKPTPPPREPERPVKWTPEAHRANTMSKFRGQLKALQEDE